MVSPPPASARLVDQILEAAGSRDSGSRDSQLKAVARYVRLHGAAIDGLESCIPMLSGVIRGDGAATGPARKRAGAFYTPTALVSHLLDHTLTPWMEAYPHRIPDILDPACGTGRFLLASGERLVADQVHRTGMSESAAWRLVGPHLHGMDTDPIAVAWLSSRLEQLAGGDPTASSGIEVADALGPKGLSTRTADLVLGNPPFGSPLRNASHAEHARRSAKELGVRVGTYTDLAAIFLGVAGMRVRRGGFLGMVQPLSILAARDAGPIRSHLLQHLTPTTAWASGKRVFDADVCTCAFTFREGAAVHDVAHVRRMVDLPVVEAPPCEMPLDTASWAILATPALGIPDLPVLATAGVVGDHAEATADFRDQYYGLKPGLSEQPATGCDGYAPVVTSGSLDTAVCHWGSKPIRLHGRRWKAPVVYLERIDPSMQQWAASRLIPKIMLPTQTRQLEPVLDQDGRWLPSVPIITITSDTDAFLPKIAAALACALISTLAAHRHLGTARSPKAIKLSARDVLQIPLPAHDAPWKAAAHQFALAQAASDEATRMHHLGQSDRLMNEAYGLPKKATGP